MFASKDVFLTPPATGGYTIARSVRFRSSASAYLNRTLTTPTNNKIFTWSGWLKLGKLSDGYGMLSTTGTGAPRSFFVIDSNTLWFLDQPSGTNANLNSVAVLRDPSAWYHIVFAVDTTQATSTNRVKMYINGVQSTLTGTYPTQNTNPILNSATAHTIGSYSINYFDGYMTEINFVDGQQLTPSSFGSTNAITGVWQPAKYTGTYGTNGFYLNFSSNGTAAALGTDFSGNSNTWTVNNISVTAGSTYDSMTDVPTLTSATAANYCVMNPLDHTNNSYASLTNGNLSVAGNTSSDSGAFAGSMSITSGKWYFEMTRVGTGNYGYAGVCVPSISSKANAEAAAGTLSGYRSDGNFYGINTSGIPSSWNTAGDVIGVAVDADNGAIYFAKNNTWQNSGVPTSGASRTGAITTFTAGSYTIAPLGGGYQSGNGVDVNFGQRSFTYTAPTGYVALNTYNLPTSTITNGAAYMAATTYTGNGGTLAVSNAVNGVSFQPDLVWIKMRSGAAGNELFDSIRGANIVLYSNATNAEANVGTMSTFGSGGFTAVYQATDVSTNNNGSTFVGWQWKAGTTSASNTNGSITSTVSAGATQGFSVATYTGNGSAGATFGHGLGVAPSFVIVKERGNANGWLCYHISTGNTGYLELDATLAFQTLSTVWNNTTPSSSVVTLGTVSNVNRSGGTFVAYCFSAVAGYSAFGSYTGNGSTDGPFVYTGFRPRWLMVKRTNTAEGWEMFDSSRDTYNPEINLLEANQSTAENSSSTSAIDFLSNGFKMRNTRNATNGTSDTYIYACFAENPFKNALAR